MVIFTEHIRTSASKNRFFNDIYEKSSRLEKAGHPHSGCAIYMILVKKKTPQPQRKIVFFLTLICVGFLGVRFEVRGE